MSDKNDRDLSELVTIGLVGVVAGALLGVLCMGIALMFGFNLLQSLGTGLVGSAIGAVGVGGLALSYFMSKSKK